MGSPPNQGKRNDIEVAREALKNGANIRNILEDSKSNQTRQFAAHWLTYFERKRKWKTHVTWFYGKTGCGKSHDAHAMYPNAYEHAGKNIKWWDGYDGHENVIIDEIKGDFCTLRDILRLTDKYPLRVENKGGYRQFLAKNLVITSSKHPRELFYVEGESEKQLMRRIDVLKEYTEEYID